MSVYFVFTDGCGQYSQERKEKFLKAHPFYVRSTVIISAEDYVNFQKTLDDIKSKYNFSDNEIKWSHYGSIIKKNPPPFLHSCSKVQIENYFKDVIDFAINLPSIDIFFTLTDNRKVSKVNTISLLKMHIQNTLQRVHYTMKGKNGFAIIFIDDLNSQNDLIKKTCYKMMQDVILYLMITSKKCIN